VSGDTRALGASILFAVDALFLGALLFIDGAAKRQYLAGMRNLGVGNPSWPDAGGAPGAALPWAAALLVALAALLLRLRVPPHPPFFLAALATLFTALALSRVEATGAAFGIGRYGTLVHVLAVVWIAHLLGAMVALARGVRSWRFLTLQALFGVGLAALVYPA